MDISSCRVRQRRGAEGTGIVFSFSRGYNVITLGETMKARLIRIGNSQGIRIPKPLLEQTGLRDEVEIEVEGNRLVICALSHPRAGWDEAFQAMARQGDDALLDGGELPPTQWDGEEWEWR
jgi:antitoxin MazE